MKCFFLFPCSYHTVPTFSALSLSGDPLGLWWSDTIEWAVQIIHKIQDPRAERDNIIMAYKRHVFLISR